MATLRLTQDDCEYLRELQHVGAGKIYLNSQRRLERAGLINISTGRFGEYVRLTEKGKTTEAVATPAGPEAALTAPAPNPHAGIENSHSGGAIERKAMIRTEKRIKKRRR